ncbi:LCP family protein [Vaginisenegalia massiliensis]|uniref:LCP family glycopolymer transferase n=1 Tax=Vaginisenegalia massiliensis TaxID=2058294 RepID=UPI000F526A7E|nr:LCP family protein [Vaginisenegalia massiliensis]
MGYNKIKHFYVKTNGKLNTKRLGLSLLVVCLIGFALTIGQAYFHLSSTLNSIKEEVVVKNLRGKKVSVKDGEPLNILLLGTDDDNLARKAQDGYVSRSDTLMIVSLNPKTHTTKMLSIPRDTYTVMKGQDGPDKINHAYAFGGVELSIDTVQNYLHVPIDYYAVVNMNGLVELVDAVGGIEVTSPLTFEYRGTKFVKGQKRKVNGVKAMNFARMRYDDPEGEMGRQTRQKMVIKALVDKMLSLDAVSNYPRLLEVIAKNTRTNFDLSTALNIYKSYLPALENIASVKFEELEDLYVDEIFYFYIPLSARVKVANELRQHTGLSPIKISDLVDPLAKDQPNFVKASAIVINQYPTGLSQEQMDAIQSKQQSVQEIRSVENYVPPTYQPGPISPAYPVNPRPEPTTPPNSDTVAPPPVTDAPVTEPVPAPPVETTPPTPVPTPPVSSGSNQ